MGPLQINAVLQPLTQFFCTASVEIKKPRLWLLSILHEKIL